MKANTLTRHYAILSPEERFRLIAAAGARGDRAEQKRLDHSGLRVGLDLPEHTPYAHAFNELSLLVIMELVEAATVYLWALICPNGSSVARSGEAAAKPPSGGPTSVPGNGDGESLTRDLDEFLALGYVLRTRAQGWSLFCERLSIPPFAGAECLPGFGRLQGALKLTERAAFVPEGMLRWVNRTCRPEGAPELKELGLTPEGVAEELDAFFRKRVAWWGGGGRG
jgi:hypothetical protein